MENRVLPIVSVLSSFVLFFLGAKQNRPNFSFLFFLSARGGGAFLRATRAESDGLGVSSKGKHCRVPQSLWFTCGILTHKWQRSEDYYADMF